jgi:hypothetical protein
MPAVATPSTTAQSAEPAEPEPPQADAPAVDVPRYSAPPESAAAPFDSSVFEEAPQTSGAAETTPAEPAAAATADEQPAAAPEEAPADPPGADEPSVTPDYDELFPPSSATGVLSAPGGWASDTTRPWSDVSGRHMATGRVTRVAPNQVVLLGDDGLARTLSYAELSSEDLSFLRDQVQARRARLASQVGGDKLLATQQQ